MFPQVTPHARRLDDLYSKHHNSPPMQPSLPNCPNSKSPHRVLRTLKYLRDLCTIELINQSTTRYRLLLMYHCCVIYGTDY